MSAAGSDVLQEIARLQAAIDRAKVRQPARGRGSFRGYGASQRGRGSSWQRGGHRSLVFNQPSGSSHAPELPKAGMDALMTPVSKHKKLVLNGSSENAPPVASTSKDVVIGGVTFLSDPRGTKLIRKGASEATPESVATPPRASVGGQTFVRTKNGNLIALALVNKRASDAKVKRINSMVSAARPFSGAQGSRRRPGNSRPLRKINELCRFFTTTGQCRSGLTCVYQHDPDKLAICPRFLRNKCTLGEACPLSHQPDGHRMPHCVHFPNCKHGASCRFPHVHVSPTAGVCKQFATLGYCEKGLGCPERHVRECPEFSEKGTCSTQGCRLPHIIRKRADPSTAAATTGVELDLASSDSDEAEVETTDATVNALKKRPLEDDDDAAVVAAALPVVKKKKRRLHDSVANQSDFLTFDDSLEIDYGFASSSAEEDEEEDDEAVPGSDVDSDVASERSEDEI